MSVREFEALTQRYRRGLDLCLPPALASNWQWQIGAACRGEPIDWFYPPLGVHGSRRKALEHRAKQACARCPVRARCLDHALRVHEPHGVWGGLTAEERAVADRADRCADP
ncbi:WhiB family transcriptional regulator [Gordonia sp. NPDC127522]|uniref:WhiB family transcriptional regulator n=1 Tax=Gordonia sp. NPDC127522 TaxID=3345390 RepID=UPI003643AB25